MYASKRDQLTWFKLKHRNLYVVNRDANIADQRCLACMTDPESMLHLAQCGRIMREYWQVLFDLMRAVGLDTVEGGYLARAAFLIFGRTEQNTVTTKEGADILAIGWRCLYAAIVAARVDSKPVNLRAAAKRALAMLISRVKAYGEKWLLWYRRTCYTSKHKHVPQKHRNYKLVKCNAQAEYSINPHT